MTIGGSNLQLNPIVETLKTAQICDLTATSCIDLTATTIDLVATSVLVNGAPINMPVGACNTGLTEGGLVTQASPTTIDITAGSGTIFYNGTFTSVIWGAFLGVAIIPAASNIVYIDDTNSVVILTTPSTTDTRRQMIILAGIGILSGVISTIVNLPMPLENLTQNVSDLAVALGIFNLSGNVYTPNGTNLSIDKSAGSIFQIGSNFQTDVHDPNTSDQVPLVAPTINLFLQNGFSSLSTFIDSANYDVGGVVTTITGATNQWQIQHIFMTVTNTIIVQYGQNLYTSMSQAVDNINTEIFNSIASRGILQRAFLILKKDTTDLSSSDNAFITASKFGADGISSGSSSTTTLQVAYLNSLIPQITTTAGTFQIRNGAGLDNAVVLAVQDIAGVSNFKITGSGICTGTRFQAVSDNPELRIKDDVNAGIADAIGTIIFQTSGNTTTARILTDGTGAFIVGTDNAAMGDFKLQSTGTTADMTIDCATGRSFRPENDNALDLGTTLKQWKDAYIAGNLTCGQITTKTNEVSIGLDAGGATNTICIGGGAGQTNLEDNCVCIGGSAGNANVRSSGTVIGANACVLGTGAHCTAVGADTICGGNFSTAIGQNASTGTFVNSIALGYNTTCSSNNQFRVMSQSGIQEFIVGSNEVCDLGTATNRFLNLHLKGDANIAGDIQLSGSIFFDGIPLYKDPGILNPEWWFNGTTLTDGASVTSWPNSGSLGDATVKQGTGGAGGGSVSTSYDSVIFANVMKLNPSNATEFCLEITSTLANQASYAMFYVFKRLSGISNDDIFFAKSAAYPGAPSDTVQWLYTGGNHKMDVTGAANQKTSTVNLAQDTWNVIGIYQEDLTKAKLYTNRTTEDFAFPLTTLAKDFTAFNLGGHFNGSVYGNWLVAEIAEIIIYAHPITPVEAQSVVDSLTTKYKTPLNAPVPALFNNLGSWDVI